MADRISFVLGEASEFDLEHGYYAQEYCQIKRAWSIIPA